MIIRIVLLLISLMVIGCAHVNPVFVEYLKEDTGNITVDFGQTEIHAILKVESAGECKPWIGYDRPAEIVVNEAEWKKLTREQREWLLQHELGHCKYKLPDEYSFDEDGCPITQMYWRIPSQECVLKYRGKNDNNKR